MSSIEAVSCTMWPEVNELQRNNSVLSVLSCCDKYLTQTGSEEERLSLILHFTDHHCGKPRQDLKAGPEAETMEEHSMLACSLLLAQPALVYSPHGHLSAQG